MPLHIPTITITGTVQHWSWQKRVLPPVEQVRRGLWSVPTPFPNNPLRYVLSYVIETPTGIALVDTGWPTELGWSGLVEGISQTGWSVTDVEAVLITHGHADHFGLARRVREASGAWIGMHRYDAPSMDGRPREAYRDADAVWLHHRGVADAYEFHAPPAPSDLLDEPFPVPDRFIEDGDRPLGSRSAVSAVWTPGHTPGHLCFLDAEHDVLLTGDHILPRISPNISPSPWMTDDILGDYLTSLAGMSDMRVGEVLPAHEYRFAGLGERVRELRAHHAERLGEVVAAVASEPGINTADLAERLIWSRPWDQMQGFIRRSAIGEAYAHAVHLERAGVIANRSDQIDAWHQVAAYDATAMFPDLSTHR